MSPRKIIPAALAAVAIICSGCESFNAAPSIHTVCVSGAVPKPANMSYSDKASTEAATFGGLLWPVTNIIASGIQAGIASAPRKALDNVSRSHGIVIESIVRDAFSAEIKHDGYFTLAPPSVCDATFYLKILDYGMTYPPGVTYNFGVAPFVCVEADLVKSNGDVVFRSKQARGLAPSTYWRPLGDFTQDPELLRAGWQAAAADAANCALEDFQGGR